MAGEEAEKSKFYCNFYNPPKMEKIELEKKENIAV